ncbi:MAG: amidohydrolase [Pseudomonadota bacterium]
MSDPIMWDILIKNGLILTLEPGAAPIAPGFAAVRNGALAAVGPMRDLAPDAAAAKTIDASGRLVMPGLVNAHGHGAMTLFRGLADDLPLMTWLNEYIFPAEARFVDEDLVYWGSKLAAAEMLLSGTTSTADGYFFEDQAARAFLEAGLRVAPGQGIIDFPAPGVKDPTLNIETAREFLQTWQGVSPLVHPSVFCHSPYTCSPDTLVKGKGLAREFGALFQIHVAETAAEVEMVRSARGLSPVRYLDSLGLLDQDTLVVHAVHLEDEEIDILAARRTPVCVCVESQMKLASGTAPAWKMLQRGVRLSLGTDGAASNNDLNMFGELRSLALLSKAFNQDPTAMPAETALYLAGPAGAEALGWGKDVGVLAPGRKADLIILDLAEPHLHPLYSPYSHLVYSASGREVETVMVEGRILVENGLATSLDLDEIQARVREIAARVRP